MKHNNCLAGEKAMSTELNEQEKKVIKQYTGFSEGKRLTYTKAHETEFINHVVQVLRK